MDIFQSLRFNLLSASNNEKLSFLTEKLMMNNNKSGQQQQSEELHNDNSMTEQSGSKTNLGLFDNLPSYLLDKFPLANSNNNTGIGSNHDEYLGTSSRSTSPTNSQNNGESSKGDLDYSNPNSKRYRTSYTQHQTKVLEANFDKERYISRPQRALLAQELGLPENTIKVWFQNRRMKEKRQSMMLPNIAGNDPQLRETLIRVAQLYYSTRYGPSGQKVEEEIQEEIKTPDESQSILMNTTPLSLTPSSGNSSSLIEQSSDWMQSPGTKRPPNNNSSTSKKQSPSTPNKRRRQEDPNTSLLDQSGKYDFDPSLFLPLFNSNALACPMTQGKPSSMKPNKRPFTVEGTLMTQTDQNDEGDSFI